MIAPNSERQLVLGTFSSVFRGSPKVKVSDWSDRNVFFDERMAAEVTRYDSSLTPWAREWMDALLDPDVNEVDIMKCSQSSASESCLNVLRFMPENFPGNALYCINSREKAADISNMRLRPTLRKTAGAQVSEDPHDFSTLTMLLRNMMIKVTGSGSASPFRETWYRVAILDEPEDHEVLKDGTTYDLVKSRFATVADYTLYVIGKPQLEGGIIHESYCKGSQERFMVPCPRCENFIELLWDNVIFDHCRDLIGGWLLDQVEADTYYRCQTCGGRVDEWEKSLMVSQGRWEPRPEKERLRIERRAVPREPGRRSFHISDLYSPFPQVSWGKLARKWLLVSSIAPSVSGRDDFRKNHLGLPVAPREMHVADDTILALCGGRVEMEEYESGTDLMGAPIVATRKKVLGEKFSLCYDPDTGEEIDYLPCDPIFLTIFADKQDEYLKFGVFAWQADGQGWFVDYGRAHDEDALLGLRHRPYHVRGEDEPRFIYGGGVDCRFRPKVVYRACIEAQRQGWQLFPIRGAGANTMLRGKTYTRKEDYLEGGIPVVLYEFHDETIKTDFYLGKVQRRESPRLWLPDPMPADVTAELTAEKLVTQPNGTKKWEHDKDKDGPNDYGDIFKVQCGVIWPILSAAL